MLISQVSEKTGVSGRCIRHYEKKGLILSSRLENGYRNYNKDTVKRVKTIHFYINLGFTTNQIASFLNCVLQHREAFCTEVKPIYEKKINELDEQIKALAEIKEKLALRFQHIQQCELSEPD